MADFLGKSKDLSKVTLELTFPAVGTHSFLEAKESFTITILECKLQYEEE